MGERTVSSGAASTFLSGRRGPRGAEGGEREQARAARVLPGNLQVPGRHGGASARADMSHAYLGTSPPPRPGHLGVRGHAARWPKAFLQNTEGRS